MKNISSLLLFAIAFGCGSSNGNSSPGTGGTGGQGFSADPPLMIGSDRPALVAIPESYDPSVQHPLLIVLHGFGPFTGEVQAGFLGILDLVDEKDLVLLMPDGTLNEDGDRFWNGASFCCDPDKAVDDVGYLSALIEEAKQTYNIDGNRVYLLGHSNGGFMSYRMACEASELITAIVSLAGSTFAEGADCKPATRPVSVLQVHGTADTTILYDGVTGVYPSAVETAEYFAAAAGCDTGSPTLLGSVDLVTTIAGEETEQVAYTAGCEDGVEAGLWTIQDGPHIPIFYPPLAGQTSFAELATDWLLQHSR